MCGQVHSQHRLKGMGSRSSTSRYGSRHACRQHGRRHCTETKSFGAEQPPWNGWNKPSLQHQIFFRDNWEMVRSDRRPACQQAGTDISTRGVSRWTRHQQLTSDRSRVPARKEARQLAVRHECLHVGTTAQVMQVQDAWALPHWKGLRSGFSYTGSWRKQSTAVLPKLKSEREPPGRVSMSTKTPSCSGVLAYHLPAQDTFAHRSSHYIVADVNSALLAKAAVYKL